MNRLPAERVRWLAHAFIRSECEEAQIRAALDDAAPVYRDAPQALSVRAAGVRFIGAFAENARPAVPKSLRVLAGNLITATFFEVGSKFSETPRSPGAMDAFADAMADMFCAYVQSLQAGNLNARREIPFPSTSK